MFEKNLSALRETHPRLAQKLQEMELSPNVSLFMGPHNDINIAYNGIALHDIDDPMGEALKIFEEQVPEEGRSYDCNLFMFGIGLGYLLRRAYVNTKGQILVFEPYLDVLRLTLEAVDFSEELRSERVRIITEVENIIGNFQNAYLLGDKFKTLPLPSYRTLEPQLLLQVLDELRSSIFTTIIGQNTVLYALEQFTRSSINNLPNLLKYPDASFLHGKFKGMPGVVVSAGPSLDRPGVLDALKANREHLIIACVGQAARALDKAGIIPDFVSFVEVKNVSPQINGVSFMDKVNLTLLPQVHGSIYDVQAKRKLITYNMRDPMTEWLSRVLKQNLYGYNHQGTVSVTALIHLMLLGCDPVFLLGQDLAYPEGKMYSDNSVYQGCRFTINENGEKIVEMANASEFYGKEGFFKDDADWQTFKRRHFEKLMVETKGWHGETLFTTPAYDGFRKVFEQIQMKQPEHNLVNCSEGGALINGMEHLPFVEALEKYNVKQFQGPQLLESLLSEQYTEREFFSEAYQNVYDSYQKDHEDLLKLESLLVEAKSELKRAKDELSKKKTITGSLKSRMKKLAQYDTDFKALTRSNMLINCYIKKDLMEYTKLYERKLRFEKNEVAAGDVDALTDNFEMTEKLYNAIEKGAKALRETLEPVFESFPAYPPSADTQAANGEKSNTMVTAVAS